MTTIVPCVVRGAVYAGLSALGLADTVLTDSCVRDLCDKCSNLRTVDFSGCSLLTVDAVDALARKHGPGVRALHLSGSGAAVPEAGNILGRWCPALHDLRMSLWAPSGSSLSRPPASTGAGNVQEHDGKAPRPSRWSDSPLTPIPGSGVDDTALHALAAGCTNLTRLELAGLSGITDKGISALRKLHALEQVRKGLWVRVGF